MSVSLFTDYISEVIIKEFYYLVDFISNILSDEFGHQINQDFIVEFVSYGAFVYYFILSIFAFWIVYKAITWVFDCFGR